jgi:hypothetical protein
MNGGDGMKGRFLIDREVYESLPVPHRWVYVELTYLAVFKEEGVWHEEYQRLVPRGSWIISYRQLMERVGITSLSRIHKVVKELAEMNIISVTDLGKIKGKDGTRPRTQFAIVNYNEQQSFPAALHAEQTDESERRKERVKERKRERTNNSPFSLSAKDFGDLIMMTENALKNAMKNGRENKKNKGFKNERFKNESKKELPWRRDLTYLALKKACNWQIKKDDAIYPLVKQALQNGDSHQIKQAWSAYCEHERGNINLIQFLISKHKEYLPVQSKYDW